MDRHEIQRLLLARYDCPFSKPFDQTIDQIKKAKLLAKSPTICKCCHGQGSWLDENGYCCDRCKEIDKPGTVTWLTGSVRLHPETRYDRATQSMVYGYRQDGGPFIESFRMEMTDYERATTSVFTDCNRKQANWIRIAAIALCAVIYAAILWSLL